MKIKFWKVMVLLSMFLLSGALTVQAQSSLEPGKYDFEFKNASIRAVLKSFAKQSNLNLVLPEDLSGNVTVALKGVTAKELLDSVLGTIGYSWSKRGNNIFVQSGNVMKTFQLQYVQAKELQTTLNELLSGGEGGGKIALYEATNSIVVQTSASNLERISRVIDEIDVPPQQVLIEAKIIELKAGNTANLGLDVKYSQNTNDFAETKGLAGRSTDSGAQGMYAQVITSNAEAYLSALSTRTGYDLISSPQITTVNHKEASLLIGAKYGYKTSTTTQTSTVQEIQYLEVGTKLTITPHITRDGYILMDLNPKVSDGQVVNDLPQETTTETSNRVLVGDGQTIILGGLIKEKETQSETGIPILMSLPIVGGLFRKTSIETEKREVLVFVTPRIINHEQLTTMQDSYSDYQDRAKKMEPSLVH